MGRISRKEYWKQYLTPWMIAATVFPLAAVAASDSILTGLCLVALVLLSLWVVVGLVKRLHDVDMSARWLLCFFVPLSGPQLIVFLIIMMGFAEGTEGSNSYGYSTRTKP